jgi:site-specific recombinase XerD
MKGTSYAKLTGDMINRNLLTIRENYSDAYNSPASFNLLKNASRSFLKWLANKYDCANLSGSIIIRRGAVTATIPIRLQEIKKLLFTISTSNDPTKERDKALMAAYAFTGMRRAEVLNLQVGDYHKESSILSVSSKGGGRRWLPVVRPLRVILDAYIEQTGNSTGRKWIFPGRNSMHSLCCRQAGNRFARWRKAAALPAELTIHSFRAGIATMFYQQTSDLLLTSRMLGHEDLKTTCKYIGNVYQIKESLEDIFQQF